MIDMDKYIKDVEATLAQIRKDLEPLESGTMKLGSKGPNDAEWKDTTQPMIERHKRNIATYESILVALRAKKAP